MRKFLVIFFSIFACVITLIIFFSLGSSAVGQPALPNPVEGAYIDEILFVDFHDDVLNMDYKRTNGSTFVTCLKSIYGGDSYFADNGIGLWYCDPFDERFDRGRLVIPYSFVGDSTDTYMIILCKYLSVSGSSLQMYNDGMSIITSSTTINNTSSSPRLDNPSFLIKNDGNFGVHDSSIYFNPSVSNGKYCLVVEGAYLVRGATNAVRFVQEYQGIDVPETVLSFYNNQLLKLYQENAYYQSLIDSGMLFIAPQFVDISYSITYHSPYIVSDTKIYNYHVDLDSDDPYFNSYFSSFLHWISDNIPLDSIVDDFRITYNFSRSYDLSVYTVYSNYNLSGRYFYSNDNSRREVLPSERFLTWSDQKLYAFTSTGLSYTYDTFLYVADIPSAGEHIEDTIGVIRNFIEYFGDAIIYLDSVGNQRYLQGYNQGVSSGYRDGYDTGFAAGATVSDYERELIRNQIREEIIASGDTYGFNGLFSAVADAPLTVVRNMLSFEILGINIAALVFGILTVLVVIILLKKFLL